MTSGSALKQKTKNQQITNIKILLQKTASVLIRKQINS